ncbi:MAG: hypothetical protein AAF610_07385 [Pseudomonadota bacterium]
MMKTPRPIALTAVALTTASCATATADEPRVPVPGPASLQSEVPADETVELRLANGEATIVAADIDHVEMSVRIRCPEDSSRCRKRAGEARLNSERSRGRTRFGLSKAPGSGAEVVFEIRVPTDRSLDVRMKYGALTIQNHADDLEVAMTAGAIDIARPENGVGRVKLAASVGESTLLTPEIAREGRRPLLVGSKVEWDGSGDDTVSARVRFGDIQLRLMP